MSDVQYKNLVFSGGGTKIFASAGVIRTLEEQGILNGIQNVSGSSAGSMLAFLVSLNMSATEIEDFFLDKFDPTSEIRDYNPIEETIRFFEEYGRYSGQTFCHQLEMLILEKTGYTDLTFKQMHEMGYKNLYVPVTDVTDKKQIVFSYDNTPNFSVIDALHASSAYPLFFTPVKLADGHFLVDGGILNNYPIDVFDQEKFLQNGARYNEQTLGVFTGCKNKQGFLGAKFDIKSMLEPFNVMDDDLIKGYLAKLNPQNFNDCDVQEYDIYCYIRELLQLNLNASKILHHESGEIFITNIYDVNSLKLDVSYEDRIELMERGKKAAENFILNIPNYCFDD